jgi:hypothetical protein
MGRKKHSSDQRADTRGGGFIGLPGVVHRSEAYRSLPAFERAVLIEIIAVFNGYNNGELVISQRQLSERLENTNYRKIGRAIAVLIERGLLDISTEGVWKQRLARQYRLTFITSGRPPFTKPASNEYLNWKKNDADDVSAGKGRSADASSAEPENLADASSAENHENPQKRVVTLNRPADAVSSLIGKPYEGTSNEPAVLTLNSRRAHRGPKAVTA